MKKEDIIETLYIKDKAVNVGMDDYGQCYYFEFIDDNGELKEVGCGTYNFNYLEEIYGYFDPKGTFISLEGQEEWDLNTKSILEHWEQSGMKDKYPEEYTNLVNSRNSNDYKIYDFEAMYRERKGS